MKPSNNMEVSMPSQRSKTISPTFDELVKKRIIVKQVERYKQRLAVKDYLKKKFTKIQSNHLENKELMERLDVIMKMLRSGKFSLNLDAMNRSKNDLRALCLFFNNIHILESVTLYSHSVQIADLEKT